MPEHGGHGKSGPRLVVFAGLPGSGKSTLARILAEQTNALWLRVDTIEASLVKAGIPRSFETGLAAYVVVRDIAADHLRLGRNAVIDAVNGVEPAREMWRELARQCSADRYVIEVQCSSPEEHRRRVETRSLSTPPLPSPTWEEVVAREYAPWREPVLVVDGIDAPEENLRRILDYVHFR